SIGQTKYVATLLDKMSSGNDPVISDPKNAIDTAIVLPSEDLFIDMLHSIPPQFAGGVNVTMGLPLRMTPVAMLLGSVTRLHQRATLVRGSWHFFYEDICDVLANPLLNSIQPDDCNSLRKELETKRMFTVPVKFIAEHFPTLADVFYGVDDLREARPVFDYSIRLLDFIEKSLPQHDNETANLERGFLLRYRMALQTLLDTVTAHDITMKENTFFSLIERAISSENASFKGEPLCGLQIMGVLETRTLDFDNVIIMSMNDRIYPRRHWTNSFIPETLRRAYGVSTSEIQESMSAYYFYRLISAARRVTLIYDSRTEAGDPSRYIHQLLFSLDPARISTHNYAYSISPGRTSSNFQIVKTPEIMERINRYRTTGQDAKYLSASSINTFLSCPLHFYFANIQELKVQDEIVDYIDYSDYGHILHTAAETIYKSYRGKASSLKVTSEVLDSILNSPTLIPTEVTNAINRHWHMLDNQHPDASGKKDDPYMNLTPLSGESLIIHGLIVKTLRKMFQLEKSMTPFEFVEGEMKLTVRLPVTSDLTINLLGYIDRVDRLSDGTIRLIDYKTGNDSTELKAITDAFESTPSSSPNKAIRQLFIYANAYAIENKYFGAIQPVIYNLKSIATQSALKPITIGADALSDYRTYNEQMMQMLGEKLSPLFDPESPIIPSPDENHCHFCNFKLLCGVAKERKF
ncbi:MAG: PD-(D/E)XK nuclease family protein, partial [Muribaculum sp.]|nr:PD-(D/E)XK nuclease family protein [Muribaculum sp.]